LKSNVTKYQEKVTELTKILGKKVKNPKKKKRSSRSTGSWCFILKQIDSSRTRRYSWQTSTIDYSFITDCPYEELQQSADECAHIYKLTNDECNNNLKQTNMK